MTTDPTVITPPPSTTARAARSAVWTLLASSLLIKAAGFAWDFLGYYVADGLGYGTTAAGAALTAFGFGWCAGLASAGALTDRLGQRAGLSIVMALSSLACFALAIAESFPALLLVSFFLGMTMEIHRPAVSAQINSTIDSEAARTRAQSWLYWASNVGIAICAAAGGYLAHHYGYKGLFIVNGLACLGFAAVAYRVLTPRALTDSAEASTVTYRQVLADPSLRWITVVAVCGMTCAWGLVSVLPLLMTDDELPPTSYGLAMFANTITVLALTPPLTRLLVGSGDTLRYPLAPVLACGCAILGLGISLAALQHSTLGYAAAAVLLVPGEIAFSVALGAYISIHAPRNATGRYQAVLSGASAVAYLPPLGVALALSTGGRPLVAALLVGSSLIALAACRPLARSLRTTQQEQARPLPTAAP
ncbi:MFS transporter [Streptomyces sp. NPDC051644]|uniref:MFS transporter n=1 Tax=Streptomyces sp. NPDC051644 TaxID=3365666 RepID=UPI0037B76278